MNRQKRINHPRKVNPPKRMSRTMDTDINRGENQNAKN